MYSLKQLTAKGHLGYLLQFPGLTTTTGSILIDLGLFSTFFVWNDINFNWKSSQNDCGRPQNIFNIILSLKTSSKVKFWTPNWILKFLTSLKIITPFLDHFFPIPYCRNLSYGPYGPFWFSAVFGWDMEKPYQKTSFWGKVTFWDNHKNELIHLW